MPYLFRNIYQALWMVELLLALSFPSYSWLHSASTITRKLKGETTSVLKNDKTHGKYLGATSKLDAKLIEDLTE